MTIASISGGGLMPASIEGRKAASGTCSIAKRTLRMLRADALP